MSEGFCEVDLGDVNDDCEPVKFADTKRVTARKAHNCIECGEPIAVGDEYVRSTYLFEGRFYTDRQCVACRETAGEFGYNVFGGGLWQNLESEWDNGAHIQACLQRLETARAKEHMRRRWLKWKGLSSSEDHR